ncbi:hypothetical protein Tco_1205578 [Tanacetum coccineum]
MWLRSGNIGWSEDRILGQNENGRDPKPGRRPDICPQSSPMKTPLPPPSSYDRPPEDEEEDDENIEEAEDPEQGAT